VEVAEARATYPNPLEAHEQRVQQLAEATDIARDGIDHLNAQLRDLEDARVEVKAQLAVLQEKERHLEKLIDQVEPSIR
jgi:phage shock protein A